MSKSATKIKNKKPVETNQKISTFFKHVDLKKCTNSNTEKNGICIIDSDDDTIESCLEKNKNKRKISLSLRKKTSTVISTKEILDDITNSTKRKFQQDKTDKTEEISLPSTSTCLGNYPEEIPDMIVNSPPRKKTSNSSNDLKIVNLSELSHEEFQLIQSVRSRNNSAEKLPKTPEKRNIFNSTLIIDCKSSKTPEKINNLDIKPIIKTPENNVTSKYFSSGKKTPRKTPVKLFSKSPQIDKFKVQVLENFIKVSPSHCNKKVSSSITPIKSIEKGQNNVLNDISPSLSNNSKIAQLENEHTPVRNEIKKNNLPSSTKAKVKLQFTEEPTISRNSNLITSPVKELVTKNISPKIEEYTFDDTWNDFDIPIQMEFNLDLSESCHCKLLEIDKKTKTSTTILVEGTDNKEKAYCTLKDIWIYTTINIGCTLRITAVKVNNDWEVSQENGLLVYEPDLLISSTTVSTSMFCKRKTVLREKFFGFDGNNQCMIVGTLVHSLLQSCVKVNANTTEKVGDIMRKMLMSKNTLLTLYTSNLKLEVIEKEMSLFIPRIVTFIEQYLPGNKVSKSSAEVVQGNWKGKIDTIQDIEENIWCPELGLKGRVDITVKTGLVIRPLELKTGRASMSLEHQGQVMFYIMMMKKLGYLVTSGFLLYLREGKFQEIALKTRDSSHLINIRNEIAYYFSQTVKVVKNDLEKLEITNCELPPPINRPNICSNCEYNVICTSYLKHENNIDKYEYFRTVQNEMLKHLEIKHIEYFMHWANMLELENVSKSNRKNVWEIFRVQPEEREQKGKCITNVKVTSCDEDMDNIYIQTFRKKFKEAVVNFLSSGITENCYVVVSTDKRPAIATGLVSSIDFESITIALDRELLKKFPNEIFHLDTYDSYSAHMFLPSALSIILEDTESSRTLRDIVVDKKPTSYVKSLHKNVLIKGKPILARLDRSQKIAVLRALQANEYLLIEGMPGTGKTATIVALVQLLIALDKTVLITSHTNFAVDNVCVRLLSCGVNVLRLGSQAKLHEKLKSRSEYALTENCKSLEELENVYEKANVVAVTCIGSKHATLSKRQFDVCIVDESTQVIQCAAFRALSVSKKFILIGDPQQLQPVVRNKEARDMGLGESLFERLQNPESTVLLNLNYRMNKTITNLANKLTYNGLLKIGSESVANANLRLPKIESFRSNYTDKRWIMNTLDDSLSKAVTIVDTGPIWDKPIVTWKAKSNSNSLNSKEESTNSQNTYEAAVVITLVYALLKAGVSPKTIGVIAPYTDQVAQLSPFLNPLLIDVSTVDQFQGQDKDVIFYSGTKSTDLSGKNNIGKFHILEDHRRLTVAITRSKHKLIIVGDVESLKLFTPFQKLFSSVESEHFIKLKDGADNFSWESIINLDEVNI